MEGNIPAPVRSSSQSHVDPETPGLQKCKLCGTVPDTQQFVECTVCKPSNGDPFLLCRDCVDDRLACIAHQANLGSHHIFRRVIPPGTSHYCNECNQPTIGDWSLTCLVCSAYSCYDMCRSCSMNPSLPHHEHALVQVSPKYILEQAHIDHLPPSSVHQPGYTGLCCDGPLCGGTARITGLAFHCTACGGSGYDLCARCADSDRATYMHDLWTNIQSHPFMVYDLRFRTSSQLPGATTQ